MNENINELAKGYNNAGFNTAGVLNIRLNVDPLMTKLEAFLRGSVVKEDIQYLETGQAVVKEVMVTIGKPKMNDIGVQSIMSSVNQLINSSVVQGNYNDETWRYEISQIRLSLTRDIIINRESWDIKSSEVEAIVDNIMYTVKPFLSRLINNEERKSYAAYEVRESSTTQPAQGMLSGLLGGRKYG